MQRTFVAFEPNEQVKEHICQLTNEIQLKYPQIKHLTKKENLHFTFRFIGDTKDEDLSKISSYLEEFATKLHPFSINNGQIEWYPFNHSPLLCLLYSFHYPNLITHYQQFGDFLRRLNYQIDNRRLNFHLTLARLKGIEIEPQNDAFQSHLTMINEIKLDKLVYYKSVLLRTGAVYQKIKEINLKEE
ncbi:MAG TPA: RNA 2',3'-cyclic phosphodiesterase [Candidatus Cloacimonadota bacterium]|nr:RNA 2',3'-cyclic phosphodiesterase [Candidatus Cloacimonadales bacterium]HPY97284.1 RNA 2',3'-cyclic phosphodiesterase [Candidatus Cloacimonadota bacterium]HQB41779.1 RNA 2',3'-cyclic phosphodiesterase [Candidatus Cloacimonadota bacterium]